jgi:hypothetical protein
MMFFVLQRVPTFTTRRAGLISLKIRTVEASGVLLYNRGQVG